MSHALYPAPCFLEFYKGKRIVLTGASRGIGRHLTIQLAQLETKYALNFNLSLLELHVYLYTVMFFIE